MRECGLKSVPDQIHYPGQSVTPRAGVWIEIVYNGEVEELVSESLPVRECGLKCPQMLRHDRTALVTPRAGVWIEIGRKNI